MRSTGPKTAAGKLKASRNAFQHGLSAAISWNSGTSAKIDAMSRVLAGEQVTKFRLTSAADFTRAQLELVDIRSIRAERLAKRLIPTTTTFRNCGAWLRWTDMNVTRSPSAGARRKISDSELGHMRFLPKRTRIRIRPVPLRGDSPDKPKLASDQIFCFCQNEPKS